MTSRTGKRRNAKRRQVEGFTLIELILVMAIMLIVVAVASPSLSSFFRGRTLDSEARKILAMTRYGQERAVSEGIPVVFWMDVKRSLYGLRQETGYTEQDPKAVEYDLAKDLKFSIADVPLATSQTALNKRTRNTDANLPMLRFQADGFIDETSPESVGIQENTGETVWITKSRNQMNYEIQTNAIRHVMR
jgi:type II secretion system protein H